MSYKFNIGDTVKNIYQKEKGIVFDCETSVHYDKYGEWWNDYIFIKSKKINGWYLFTDNFVPTRMLLIEKTKDGNS